MGDVINITKTVPGKHHTHQGALALMRRIERYWHERGYHKIHVEVVRREYMELNGETYADFDIRSNMINGYPPK